MLHTISRQRATFIFIITLLCFIGLFSPVQGRAADLPDRAEVQSQLNTLNKQKELTPQDKLVQQDLTQTLETLDKIERIKSETAQLRQQVEQAPAKLRQAVESLNNLSDVPNDDATRKTLSTLSCVSWSRASPRRWTICRMRKMIWRPITANWFPCKRSRNACKMRCSTPPSSCSRSAIV